LIALADVSAEFGVVMRIDLRLARAARGSDPDGAQLEAAIRERNCCAYGPRQ
jgi:Cu(I)/Ag(I) efflux system membrane protein CusA/SilA